MGIYTDIIKGFIIFKDQGFIVEAPVFNIIPILKGLFYILDKKELSEIYRSKDFQNRRSLKLINITSSTMKRYFNFLMKEYPSKPFSLVTSIPDVILDLEEFSIYFLDTYKKKLKDVCLDPFSVNFLAMDKLNSQYFDLKRRKITPEYISKRRIDENSKMIPIDKFYSNIAKIQNRIKLEKIIDKTKEEYAFNENLTIEQNSILNSIFKNGFLIIAELVKLHKNYTREEMRRIVMELYDEGYLNSIEVNNFKAFSIYTEKKSIIKRYESLLSVLAPILEKKGALKPKEIYLEVKIQIPYISRFVLYDALDYLLSNNLIGSRIYQIYLGTFLSNIKFYFTKGNEELANERFNQIIRDFKQKKTGNRRKKRVDQCLKEVESAMSLNPSEMEYLRWKLDIIDLGNLFRGRNIRDVIFSLAYLVFHFKFNIVQFCSKNGVSRAIFRKILRIHGKQLMVYPQYQRFFYLLNSFFSDHKEINLFFIEKVQTLFKNVIDNNLHLGKSPEGLIAAIIYICQLSDGNITFSQKELAAYFNITEVTIRNTYKKIKKSL